MKITKKMAALAALREANENYAFTQFLARPDGLYATNGKALARHDWPNDDRPDRDYVLDAARVLAMVKAHGAADVAALEVPGWGSFPPIAEAVAAHWTPGKRYVKHEGVNVAALLGVCRTLKAWGETFPEEGYAARWTPGPKGLDVEIGLGAAFRVERLGGVEAPMLGLDPAQLSRLLKASVADVVALYWPTGRASAKRPLLVEAPGFLGILMPLATWSAAA